MIVLDTNVISETNRTQPNRRVLAWLDAQGPADLALTAVTVAELRAGAARLPVSRRRASLERWLAGDALASVGSVLPFGSEATQFYADIVASRRRAGRPVSVLDAQIAAICRQYDATLATRNVKDFEGTGVELINPWDAN